jgi:hypothetical protein
VRIRIVKKFNVSASVADLDPGTGAGSEMNFFRISDSGFGPMLAFFGEISYIRVSAESFYVIYMKMGYS